MNIKDFDRLYRRTRGGEGDSSALVRLKLNPIRQGVLRTLNRVTVENKTSGYTKCRLGIAAGDRDHYLDELITIAANELAVSRSEILLHEGDEFFAELTGTSDGDVLVMTCIGWELDMK